MSKKKPKKPEREQPSDAERRRGFLRKLAEIIEKLRQRRR